MDHGDDNIDKKICIPPPILQEEIKDVCENCKVYKAANETLTAENAKLRDFINDLLVETGRNSENLGHFLATGEIRKNLDEVTAKNFAAQKALANFVILRNVFGYFDDPILLQFRRVCKFWAEEASACLLIFKDPSTYESWDKVPPAQVRLSYNIKESTLGKNGVGTLQNLVELMKSGLKAGRKFPCSRFSITCPNLLPTVVPDAVELLEKFGHLIESLVFEFVNLPNSPLTNRDITEGLQNLLFKWALNLKYFYFKVERWPSDDPVPFLNDENSSRSLPNLQYLSWYNRRRGELHIYEDILRISPNLKLSNYSTMNEVVQANRTDAIREIQVSFTSDFFAATPRLFLEKEFCTKVEKIKIDYHFPRGLDQDPNVLSLLEDWKSNVRLLNKVLYNNRESLTKIECQNLGPLVQCGLEVPVMPNLKVLEITTDFESRLISAQNNPLAHDFFRMFPEGLDVASTLPKLAHILWNMKIKEDFFNALGSSNVFLQLPVFDTMGPLTSVRSLTFQIVERKNVEFLARVAVCLPNVRKLTVDYNERFCSTCFGEDVASIEPAFPKILRILWDLFQGLEEIHLLPYLKDVPKRIFLKDNPTHLVDSAITGLDLATIKQLAGTCSENTQVGGSSDILEDPKVPSIRNMKRLRYLKISVQSKNDFPLVSHVSGTHGFGLMSNVAIVIEAKGEQSSVIDDPKGLMSSYVKFSQIPRKRKPKW